jgi:hypothetical protein
LPRLTSRVAGVPLGFLIGTIKDRTRQSRRPGLLGGLPLGLKFGFAGQGGCEFGFFAPTSFFFLALALFLQQSLFLGLPRQARIVDGLALSRNGLAARIVRTRPGPKLFDEGHLGR